jgi:Domain of unknown function (DUF1877)
MGVVVCLTSLSPEALQELQDEPELIEGYLCPDDGEPPHYIDLDKSWHGVHYLLTGQSQGGPEPQSLAVFGGEEFGPEIGYGPARFLTADQVQEMADALARLPAEVLAKRFNPEDMAAKEIYPDVIWLRDGPRALDYALEGYQRLQAFYRDAAARGEAVLQWQS